MAKKADIPEKFFCDTGILLLDYNSNDKFKNIRQPYVIIDRCNITDTFKDHITLTSNVKIMAIYLEKIHLNKCFIIKVIDFNYYHVPFYVNNINDIDNILFHLCLGPLLQAIQI